jgi:hypothetical protein
MHSLFDTWRPLPSTLLKALPISLHLKKSQEKKEQNHD